MKLTFAGTEFEFDEFRKIHNAYPRLFQPAFSLQQSMMIGFKGENWWNNKKQLIINIKELADEKIKLIEKKNEKKKLRKKNRKTLRAMGSLRYYLCPCMRKYYDPSLSSYDKLSEEEKAARDKEIAIIRRQAELKIKNPETAVWLKYQKKIANENQVYAIEEIDEGLENENLTLEQKNEIELKEKITSATAIATAGLNKFGKNVKQSNQTTKSIVDSVYIQPSIAKTKKVVVNSYLDDKVKVTSEMRADRAESRAERKARRDKDPDLKQKTRTTVSGAEY